MIASLMVGAPIQTSPSAEPLAAGNSGLRPAFISRPLPGCSHSFSGVYGRYPRGSDSSLLRFKIPNSRSTTAAQPPRSCPARDNCLIAPFFKMGLPTQKPIKSRTGRLRLSSRLLLAKTPCATSKLGSAVRRDDINRPPARKHHRPTLSNPLPA